MSNLYTTENPVFAGLAFYGGILILKMFVVAVLTGMQRMRKKAEHNTRISINQLNYLRRFTIILPILGNTLSILIIKFLFNVLLNEYRRLKKRFSRKVFVNAEDAKLNNVDIKNETDEDVERLRRAHMNDLENIPLFLITGLIFVGSDPNAIFALMMFRLYTIARIGHTIVYAVYIVKQPTRTVFFFIGLLINIILLLCNFIAFPQL